MTEVSRLVPYPKKRAVLAAMFFILCAIVFAALWTGGTDMGIADMLRALFGNGDERNILVLREIRLPRVATAVFGGAGLAVTGCVLQCVLRNPLASASTLGISQGASFGAAFAIMALGSGSTVSFFPFDAFGGYASVAMCAFVGALLSALVILAVSRIAHATSESVVLCGVALGAMFAGAVALMQYFADELDVASLVFWTFGDLGRASAEGAFAIAAVSVAALAVCLFQQWNLNALEFGDHIAASLGVRVVAFRMSMVILCSLAAAVTVSFVGIINFVGLISPHIARKFVGSGYAFLLPASAMTGAALLLSGDIAARTLAAPVVLPIGALTSLLGAPMFLYLLVSGVRAK